MISETICDGEDERCQGCGQHRSVCTCLRHFSDGTNAPRFVVAHATKHELRWRHSHWWARREKVTTAMKATQASWKKIERFEHCGACARVQWSPSEKRRRITASYCHDRHCEPCMRAKANRLAGNLRHKLDATAVNKHRFITLTLAHSQAPLKEQIRRLYKAFRKMRSRPLWKNAVHGGAATLEVKRNGDEWHPHLHIVADAKWINKNELSREWKECTGDSIIVDIQLIKRAKDVAFYVAKYVSKGTSPEVWNTPETAAEWLTAVKGIRTCIPFGLWRGFKLTSPPKDPGDWETEDSLDRLIIRASEAELVASSILLTLRPPGSSDAIDWQ